MARTWIPAGRLLSILDRVANLEDELCETESRFVRSLRQGHQAFVSLERADRLLTRLHLHHWFHVLKEDGGLADIYEGEADYGAPNRTGVARSNLLHNRKYATQAERLAARRATYRAYYERKKERRAA